jgi:hypothetical protein
LGEGGWKGWWGETINTDGWELLFYIFMALFFNIYNSINIKNSIYWIKYYSIMEGQFQWNSCLFGCIPFLRVIILFRIYIGLFLKNKRNNYSLRNVISFSKKKKKSLFFLQT